MDTLIAPNIDGEPDSVVAPAAPCSRSWTRREAVALAMLFEALAPEFGCHVGLTGGCLYKDGPRKDCDILIYRIRQAERINIEGLMTALENVGVIVKAGFGFCYKCEWAGKPLDILIPEEPGGDYQEPPQQDSGNDKAVAVARSGSDPP